MTPEQEAAVKAVKDAEKAIQETLDAQKKATDDGIRDVSQKLGDELKSRSEAWDAAIKDVRACYEKGISETNAQNVELKRRLDDFETRAGRPGGATGTLERKSFATPGKQFIDRMQSGDWDNVIGRKADRFSILSETRKSPSFEFKTSDFVRQAMIVRAREMGIESKATLLSDATDFAGYMQGAPIEFPRRRLSLRQFIGVTPTDKPSVRYIRNNGMAPETALAMTSITSTALVATATTAAAHGMKQGQFVQILDSTDTEYNGRFRIDTVPSTTTFTYTMLTDPADDTADGTILYRPIGSGGAAARAEGAVKAESKFLWEQITATLESVAHYAQASKEVLDDLPQLRSIIDDFLLYGLMLKEEEYGFYGSGSSNQPLGINNVPGIQTLTQGALSAVDVIRRARTLVQLTDLMADLVVMNPLDWEAVEIKKGSDDHYVLTNGADGSDPRIWRMPVLETNSVYPGDVFVGAFGMGGELLERESASLAFTDSHSTNFVYNLLTMRAESRIAYEWFYPQAFVKIAFTG